MEHVHPKTTRAARASATRVRRGPVTAVPADREIEAPFADDLRSAVRAGFHVTLIGPRGTGKTSGVRRLAKAAGRTLFEVQGHADLVVEELRGRVGLRAGETAFEPGVVTRAVKDGAWLLFDELNLCRPGVSALLNDVLDDDGVLAIPETGEQLAVSSTFRAFFAYNTGYAGTREVNQALLDRTRVLHCDYWLPEMEFQVVRRRLDRIPHITCADVDVHRVIKVANAVREARRKGSIDFDFSVRTEVQWLVDACDVTQDLIESFRRAVLPKVGDPVQDGPQHEALLELARVVIGGG